MTDLDAALKQDAMSTFETKKAMEPQYLAISRTHKFYCGLAQAATDGAFKLKKIRIDRQVFLFDEEVRAKVGSPIYVLHDDDLIRVDVAINDAERSAAFYKAKCDTPGL